MSGLKAKGGKKNRKFGRQKRHPASQRYTSSKRWITNKAKKIAKYMIKFPNWKPNNLSPEVNVKVKAYIAKAG